MMHARRKRIANPKKRMLFVISFGVIALVILLGRLVAIQAMDTSQLAERALAARLVEKTLPAKRGVILAADGTVLADNAERYQLVVDQQNVARYKNDKGELVGAWGAAQAIAPILHTEAGLIYPKLNGDRLWNVVASGLTSEVWSQIRDLRIPGISVETSSVRTYPAGGLGGNLVGFVGSDGEPLAGLELSYRDTLQGTDGVEQYEKGASGDIIPLGDNNSTPAVDGTGLQLTIDPEIQLYAQDQIAQAVKEHKAEWGTVVILESQTGRILAAADAPSVDPNNPGKTKAEARGSRVFTDLFEPGSTSKMVTAAGLLETGKAQIDSQFVVPDELKLDNGEVFRDSSNHPEENLTLAGILMDSSNTGTILAGQSLTEQERYDWLQKFGFGTAGPVQFPGTSPGILHQPSAWDGRTKYTVMFGQGVAANSLQTANAFSIIANDGMYIPEQLVSGTVNSAGKVTQIPVVDGQRIVSADTAAKTRRILEAVVENGTGANAKVPDYRVGGKTGTAQAPAANGKGYDGYTASFVGIAPIENPKITVAVTLQRPRKGYYGGTSAAPVFSDVTGYTLRHLGVAPSTQKPDLPAKEWKE